ncbi:hypothetical protein PRIPAC_75163, partial [Pristionchus pacificus]|uniref:Uncharacterized protein n=1 Tax=Pristionchus pacificus TaxID=54126 RepID=A0A2A6BRJ3_PRIPA
MCNGRRPSPTPGPDTEDNQSTHLATTRPQLRPSPPRPLPAHTAIEEEYPWRFDADPTKDYSLICAGLKTCARSAEIL